MTAATKDPGPVVSVIVPVYQGARFLARALESVQAQDYRPIETIVVDDGSTDGSGDIAAGYAGVRCLRQEHSGVSAARNTGVAAATGSVIAFLDADDVWLPGKLSRQIECLDARPEVGYCFTMQRCILEPSSSRPSWLRPELLDADSVAHLPSALVVRAEVLARVGPFDVSLAIGEDGDWFFRAKDLGIVMAVVPETLLLKRIHDTNLSSDVALSHRALLDIVRRSMRGRRSEAPPAEDPGTAHGS